MLVGDILLSAREAVPDLPGVMPSPLPAQVVFTAVSSANPLPAATYFLQASFTNPWGETAATAETSVSLNGSQALQVGSAGYPYLPIVLALNVYVGGVSGAEAQQYALEVTPSSPNGTIDSTTEFTVCTPPLGNSAFLPDSGGAICSASQIYRFLNDAMNLIAIANGGVPDVAGFATTIGKADYAMQGDWKDIDAAWYDGYPIMLGSGKQVYRHNSLTSISGMMSYVQVGKQLVCELFPQPVRTAGVTSLSAAITALATSATTPGFTNFVLPYGILQFGAGNKCEYVSFTSSGNNIVSMVRGLGGTAPQAWPINTPVNEMNVQFAGWRAPTLYKPGDALCNLNIPSDWVPLCHKYLLGRYRQIEQQQDDTTKLEQEFMAGMAKATKRKAPIGERQIQPQDTTMVDVYPGLSRTFGGLIIP